MQHLKLSFSLWIWKILGQKEQNFSGFKYSSDSIYYILYINDFTTYLFKIETVLSATDSSYDTDLQGT